MLKTDQFLHVQLFFLKIRFFLAAIVTIGFSRPETTDFQKQKVKYEKIYKFVTFW